MKKLFFFISILLSGCGSEPTSEAPQQLPGITKSLYLTDAAESSVVVLGGQLVHVVSRRPAVANGTSTTTIYRDQEALNVPAPGFEFISALVHNEVMYVFGTIENRYIQMVSSSDLVTWTHPVTVIEINGSKVYNTSVTRDADGFVLAYETDSNVPFTVHFAKSYDLLSWFQIGTAFHPEIYAACPVIKFIDGYYYVFYLKKTGQPYKYYTWAERSTDLVNWQAQKSRFAVLSPEAGEGINASDMDLTELNGTTYIVYSAGDQSTWGHVKIAVYQGTIANLVSSLFAN